MSTGTVSLESATDAYLVNASYDVEGSLPKARAFLVACRQLALILPMRASHGGPKGEEIQIDPTQVHEREKACRRWLSDRTTTGPTFADLRSFRD